MAGPGNELPYVEDWLRDFLADDATLNAVIGGSAADARVWSDVAPEGSPYPFVRFGYQGGTDVGNASAERIMHSGLWLVAGVAEGRSYQGDLKIIANRIDVLLHRSNGGTADGAVVFTSVREQAYRMPEVEDGAEFRHLGGIYRIHVQIPA